MRILSIVLGVLLTLCGFGCVLRPGETFLQTGYMLALLLLICGIEGIIMAIATKRFGLRFAESIIAIIVGVIAVLRPATTLAIDAMLIFVIAFFFVIRGIISIVMAFNLKKYGAGAVWVLGLIIGILAIILGVYSFIHPMFAALTIGFLVGFYFIEAGIDMIIFSSVNPS